MLNEQEFRKVKILGALFFGLWIFLLVMSYYGEKDYKVGNMYLKSEEYFYVNKFPNLYESQIKSLNIYVLYTNEGNDRSMIIFDSLPKQ